MRLSSIAEELAAWAIVDQAMGGIEFDAEKSRKKSEHAFDRFIRVYFEDLDFLFLFEDEYDGIDETPVAAALGLFSLSFDDWFKPFSEEPERIAHPYVS